MSVLTVSCAEHSLPQIQLNSAAAVEDTETKSFLVYDEKKLFKARYLF